jgi:Uri superfamily endonuclease
MLPAGNGTYLLILHLEHAARLGIGRLGEFDLAAGCYAYVGSAFGPGGLRGRLKHHLAPVSKPHWHIDYLRRAAPLAEVWFVADEAVREHAWAARLMELPGAAMPVPRFGASDCKCSAHLAYFPARPDPTAFNAAAGVSLAIRPVQA